MLYEFVDTWDGIVEMMDEFVEVFDEFDLTNWDYTEFIICDFIAKPSESLSD